LQEIIENFVKPFVLSRAPLLRVGLINSGEQSRILMVDMHHIIADAVSQNVLYRDFLAFYNSRRLTPLKIRYKDYSQWQKLEMKEAKIKQQEAYWLGQFEGDITGMNLPADYPRPPFYSVEGSVVRFEIGKEETGALKKTAESEGCTMFIVMLAIYNILLSKICGQSDLIIGTLIAGRRHTELQPLIGMFVNMLALRNFPAANKTFVDFLREVKNRTARAFENQDYPFEDLVDKLEMNREVNRNPLVDVVISIVSTEESPLQMPTGSREAAPGYREDPTAYGRNITRFDLHLFGAVEKDRISFVLIYKTTLFKKETIERLCAYFKEIVASAAAGSNKKIEEIEIISDEKRSRLIEKLGDKRRSLSPRQKKEQPEIAEMAADFDY
jgi:fengycin family lipopeptide synthetase D